jgi:hypothetical protein
MFHQFGVSGVFGSPAGSLCNHAPSVGRARFVTAGAIDQKLCTYVPLGKSKSDPISVQSDSWFGHQGDKTENIKSAITPELMAGSSPNFYPRYLIRIHHIIPGFLICPTFEGHRGQSSKRHCCWYVLLIFDLPGRTF